LRYKENLLSLLLYESAVVKNSEFRHYRLFSFYNILVFVCFFKIVGQHHEPYAVL